MKKNRKLEDRFDMGYNEGLATTVTRSICTGCDNNRLGSCVYFKIDILDEKVRKIKAKGECVGFTPSR